MFVHIGSPIFFQKTVTTQGNNSIYSIKSVWGKIVLISDFKNFIFLWQINYKASLLHLQPRQMRLEIIDLKEENLDPFNDEFNGTDLDDLASWIGEDDQVLIY